MTRRQSIEATTYDPAIFSIVRDLLHDAHDPNVPLRLVGVGLSNLLPDIEMQDELFPAGGKRDTMLKAVDHIREKYGENIIAIGSA